jgi:4-alpha-glucanotransferase
LLSAIHVPTESSEVIAKHLQEKNNPTLQTRWMDHVMVRSDEVVRQKGLPVNINWPPSLGGQFQWSLFPEGQTNAVASGSFCKEHCEFVEGSQQQFLFFIPEASTIPQGYHHLKLSHSETAQQEYMKIIITPLRCFRPSVMGGWEKVWAPSVQLYAVNSMRNWGIGDFTDLKTLASWCVNAGASLVGVNPLHSLYPHNPTHCSPYSPSSRLYVNIMNLDVEAIEEYLTASEVQQQVQSTAFLEKLTRARQAELVDYVQVAELKLPVLRNLYQHFKTTHLQGNTQRAEAFKAFVQHEGEALKQFALFHALQQHFFEQDASVWGWQAWPEAYQNPDSEAVKAFLSEDYDAVEFQMYLQWQIDQQLGAIQTVFQNTDGALGLYMDMAVGVDRGGADVWANQDLFMASSSVGAPPDEYNPMGQDWGLPPLIPARLREQQYHYFIQMVQKSMRYAGALRIDHIMGIMRLFLIPPGRSPQEGAYMHYPMDELLGILALESHRNQCLVIGEDMGTVSDVVRERMQAMDIFSYKVFCFEKHLGVTLKQPYEYYQDAVVAISTHDMPTLQGFWQGRDLDVRTQLDLYPAEALRHAHCEERLRDRVAMLRLLESNGLLPNGIIIDAHNLENIPPMTHDLLIAFHQLVAKSTTRIFTIQLEDVLHQVEQINLPGVSNPVYPCWKRKLTQPLEELLTGQALQSLASAINQARTS